MTLKCHNYSTRHPHWLLCVDSWASNHFMFTYVEGLPFPNTTWKLCVCLFIVKHAQCSHVCPSNHWCWLTSSQVFEWDSHPCAPILLTPRTQFCLWWGKQKLPIRSYDLPLYRIIDTPISLRSEVPCHVFFLLKFLSFLYGALQGNVKITAHDLFFIARSAGFGQKL